MLDGKMASAGYLAIVLFLSTANGLWERNYGSRKGNTLFR